MGVLVDGQWVADDEVATSADGKFKRAESVRRDWIRADGSTAYLPEPGRYHLWLAWNCTWSQRTMIALNLLGLGEQVTCSMAHFHRNEGGWWFRDGIDELQPDEPQSLENGARRKGFRRRNQR